MGYANFSMCKGHLRAYIGLYRKSLSSWSCNSLIEIYNLYFANIRAAYKGFGDCIRLLLFLDAHRTRQDKEGIHHVSTPFAFKV